MRYYLIAGEASGDLHGANLMKGLLKSDPKAEFRFWGGDRMVEVGGVNRLARHYKTTSFFGVMEIVKNLRTIFVQLKECKADVTNFKPDVLILIDYPGFNFKMAKFAHQEGISTFYYISPKVWAWKESRVKLIRKYVDKLFIIFPFEIDYFRKKGIEAIYEGNPIMDCIVEETAAMPSKEQFFEDNGLENRPTIALLAGSRKSEIRNNLPFMVELSEEFPNYQFVVAGVSWLDKELYDKYLSGSSVKYVVDNTYPLLSYSDAAVVTSGTATLETALIGTPEMVCYRMDEISFRIVKFVVKIPYVSLVNIIMGREVVRELLQSDMTVEKAAEELKSILPGGEKHLLMKSDYERLRRAVGEAGASDRVAEKMVKLLENK